MIAIPLPQPPAQPPPPPPAEDPDSDDEADVLDFMEIVASFLAAVPAEPDLDGTSAAMEIDHEPAPAPVLESTPDPGARTAPSPTLGPTPHPGTAHAQYSLTQDSAIPMGTFAEASCTQDFTPTTTSTSAPLPTSTNTTTTTSNLPPDPAPPQCPNPENTNVKAVRSPSPSLAPEDDVPAVVSSAPASSSVPASAPASTDASVRPEPDASADASITSLPGAAAPTSASTPARDAAPVLESTPDPGARTAPGPTLGPTPHPGTAHAQYSLTQDSATPMGTFAEASCTQDFTPTTTSTSAPLPTSTNTTTTTSNLPPDPAPPQCPNPENTNVKAVRSPSPSLAPEDDVPAVVSSAPASASVPASTPASAFALPGSVHAPDSNASPKASPAQNLSATPTPALTISAATHTPLSMPASTHASCATLTTDVSVHPEPDAPADASSTSPPGAAAPTSASAPVRDATSSPKYGEADGSRVTGAPPTPEALAPVVAPASPIFASSPLYSALQVLGPTCSDSAPILVTSVTAPAREHVPKLTASSGSAASPMCIGEDDEEEDGQGMAGAADLASGDDVAHLEAASSPSLDCRSQRDCTVDSTSTLKSSCGTDCSVDVVGNAEVQTISDSPTDPDGSDVVSTIIVEDSDDAADCAPLFRPVPNAEPGLCADNADSDALIGTESHLSPARSLNAQGCPNANPIPPSTPGLADRAETDPAHISAPVCPSAHEGASVACSRDAAFDPTLDPFSAADLSPAADVPSASTSTSTSSPAQPFEHQEPQSPTVIPASSCCIVVEDSTHDSKQDISHSAHDAHPHSGTSPNNDPAAGIADSAITSPPDGVDLVTPLLEAGGGANPRSVGNTSAEDLAQELRAKVLAMEVLRPSVLHSH